MRKTKDDRVKITTHHFRISIEEEEDDEDNKETEDQTIREMDRKISITIETDSNVTIGGQESGIKNFSFDQNQESLFSINDQSADKILNKNVEDNWNERERRRTSEFQFGASIESDSSIEDRNDDQKRRKMDEVVDENFSDDSGRSRKQLEKKQSDSLESETRSLATSTEVSNENRGIFGSSNEISPPSTSFEQKGNFGPIYSTIKYSIEGCSYEDANSINKLDHVGSISTASFLPFVEISNPGSTIKRHGSLSTYETRLSSMNSPVERKRTQSTNEKMLQHSKKAFPRSSERKQSITSTPEIQETSALDHPIVSSEVSPLLARRCYKFTPTFPPHSSSLETGENSLEARDIATNKTRNTESSSFNVDPNSKDASIKSSKIEELAYPSIPRVSPLLLRRYYKIMSARSSSLDEISCKNHREEEQDSSNTKEPMINNQNSEEANAAQRRSTLPMMNVDLNSKSVPKSPNYQDVLSGTGVNPIRRSSIASAAICSSLAPSLVSASQGIPNCLLPISDEKEVSNVSRNIGDHGRSGIRLKLPFLKIHIPVQQPATGSWSTSKEDVGHHYSHHHHHHHHHHHVFPHFHVPTFTFTATGTDGTDSGRKFNFGIRRHSQMVS